MQIVNTVLDGLIVIEPKVFEDPRGFFLETYRKNRYGEAGLPAFVQDNHSRSARGVLRGLHFQIRHGQGKLVFVTRGEIFDVAVDLRRGSGTFGKWHAVIVNDNNHRQIYIPPGFAHGFQTLSDTADVFYKCTDYYRPEDEGGLIWNDPQVGIEWPLRDEARISEKDRLFPTLSDIGPESLPRP